MASPGTRGEWCRWAVDPVLCARRGITRRFASWLAPLWYRCCESAAWWSVLARRDRVFHDPGLKTTYLRLSRVWSRPGCGGWWLWLGMCPGGWCWGWPGFSAGQGQLVAGGGGGGLAGLGADGFEQVVGGGPQVKLELGFGVPVVQGAAEAVEQLGEDRLDDAGPLFVEGLAFGGVQPGGHLLPGGFHRLGVLAVAQPPGLAGFPGDRDIQLRLAGGGEVVLAGIPGVEQRRADRVADAGGIQAGTALVQQPVQGAGVSGAVVGGDGQDDLVLAGQHLDVVMLVEAALLGGHDPAGRVGDVGLGRRVLRRRGRGR